MHFSIFGPNECGVSLCDLNEIIGAGNKNVETEILSRCRRMGFPSRKKSFSLRADIFPPYPLLISEHLLRESTPSQVFIIVCIATAWIEKKSNYFWNDGQNCALPYEATSLIYHLLNILQYANVPSMNPNLLRTPVQ